MEWPSRFAPLLGDWLTERERTGASHAADALRMQIARWVLAGFPGGSRPLQEEVFWFQSQHNPVYRRYLELLGFHRDRHFEPGEVPFLPVELFQTQDVLSVPEVGTWFRSSGTTGSRVSRHGVDDLSWYHAMARTGFERIYGDLAAWEVFALLPGYVERPDASLISMVQSWMPDGGEGRFGLENHRNWEGQIHSRLTRSDRRILLIGVTHALLDWVESGIPDSFLEAIQGRLVVMETGGMKGRRRELVRPELRARLRAVLGDVAIHSEYGMTEMLSQAYADESGHFVPPPWLVPMVGEVDDPLAGAALGRTGRLRWIDLANVHSCSFLATGDLGRWNAPASGVEVLGRYDHAEVRGCNLMVP
ncbi:MAG: hypothetical protein RJA19_1560 [Bacteroidota bacterium]